MPAHGARLPTVACLIVFLLLPATVVAQRDAFVQALLDFHAHLAGTYGDEGPLILTSLDRMAASLTAWERDIRESEILLPPRAATAVGADRVMLHTELAAVYLERGRHADALREIDAALAVDDARAGLHLYRALTLTALGRRDAARSAHRQAWALEPGDPVKAYLLLEHLAENDVAADVDAPLATLLAALDARGASGRPLTMPFVSVEVVSDRLAGAPLFAPVAYAPGFALLARGAYAEAIVRLREVAARDPLVAARVVRSDGMRNGAASIRRGDLAAAIGHLQRAVDANPDASEAHRMLGAVYIAAGESDAGLAHLEVAVQLSPRDERTRLTLGRGFAMTGRLEQAERALRETLAVLPESREARWPLADVYVALGREADAIAQLETLASVTVLAGRHEIFSRLAVLYNRHLQFDRLARALSVRARLVPNSWSVHKDLASVYKMAGRDRAALAEFVMSALMGPENPDTLTAIGQLQVNAGRYSRAEPFLRRAVELRPRSARARHALGTTLVRLGRVVEGRRELARFAELRAAELEQEQRSFEMSRFRLEAERRAREGRHDLAAVLWQQLIDMKPDEPDLHVALGEALVENGRLRPAAGHMAIAAALGADVDVYRRLAEIYEALGHTAASATARVLHDRHVKEHGSRAAFERLEPRP